MSDNLFAAPIGVGQRPMSAKRARGRLRTILIVAVVVVIAAIAAPLIWRMTAQHGAAEAQRLTTPNAIQEASFVPVNGIEQWVTIRGEDRRNPVLVILPDGPGDSTTALVSRYRDWEKYFTIVQWDPPGAGRTLGRNPGHPQSAYSADELARSGDAVIAYALTRTGQTRAGLMAGGFGSVIAVRMARNHPERLYAYIGVGQIVAQPSVRDQALYRQMTATAQSADDALGQGDLRAAGPPPWTTPARQATARRLVSGYFNTEHPRGDDLFMEMFAAPGWSLGDVMAFYDARKQGLARLDTDSADFDARALAPDLTVPTLIVIGTRDGTAPETLEEPWFNRLTGAWRRYVPQPLFSHDIPATQNSVLEQLVTTLVMPLARAPAPTPAPARPAG